MREAELRDVLLVRAFEEADAEGKWLDLRERQVASRTTRHELASGGGEPDAEEFLARRAARLRERLIRSHPRVGRVFELSARRGLPVWGGFLGALVMGAMVDRIGSSQQINLLNFPILGLVVYNASIYLWLFFADLGSFGGRRLGEGRASRAAASGLLARALLWAASPDRFWSRSARADGEVAVAAQRYVRDWYRTARRLHLARGAAWLHAAAAGLMVGAILAMYMGGLVLHYEARWESTFLSPSTVHWILESAFAPATWVTGMSVPDSAAIEAMRAPEGAGDAALWIHLYSATGLLWVIVPRLALAFFAWRSSKSLERDTPLQVEEDAYFLRLLATERGAGREVTIEPYSYHLAPRAADGLKGLLLDLFGGRVRVASLDTVSYGGASQGRSPEGAVASCHVVVFSLAQSPEHEVHGEFVRELCERIGGAPGQRALLVILDRGPYLQRLGRDPEAKDRLEERERNWARVLRELGIEGLACELEGRPEALVLETARGCLWPAPLAGEGA